MLAVLIQNTSWHLPLPGGVRVFIVLPLAVCIAMFEREIASALFGAFAGVLWDISSGADGFNALVIMLLCAVCSVLVSRIMRNNIATALVLSACAAAVYIFVYTFVFNVFAGGFALGAVLSYYVPAFALTTAAAVPVWYAVRAVYMNHKTDE